MQPQESFVSSAGYSFWAHFWAHATRFFARSVQKTEGKRDKATVSLTVASNKKHLFHRALPARDVNTIEGTEHRRVTTRANPRPLWGQETPPSPPAADEQAAAINVSTLNTSSL
jgi:hypothetical protein